MNNEKCIESNVFYHVSMDLNINEKEFIPRIPTLICKDEDTNIKRICVTKTLEQAIGAFPYKRVFMNETIPMRNESYLAVYKTDMANKEYLNDKEINKYVPDAHITNEHWILNSFNCKPYLIRVKNLKLSSFSKYTDEWSGFVKSIDYDKSKENYDREMTYSYIDKKFLKKALDFAKKNNIKYSLLDQCRGHLYHRTYALFMFCIEKYFGTSKTHLLTKIQFYIPKNVDVSNLWIINEEQNKWSIKKNLSFKLFNKSIYDELRKCEEDYQGFFEEEYKKEA